MIFGGEEWIELFFITTFLAIETDSCSHQPGLSRKKIFLSHGLAGTLIETMTGEHIREPGERISATHTNFLLGITFSPLADIRVQFFASPGNKEHSLIDEKISGAQYGLNLRFGALDFIIYSKVISTRFKAWFGESMKKITVYRAMKRKIKSLTKKVMGEENPSYWEKNRKDRSRNE
ncbi:MAG: hypothetical protein KGY70_18605 [Bacteroidales bacterium]|nr:hypothetical protein [Bacteroidales bacterium]